MREILFKAKAINRKDYYRSNYKDGDWVYGLITKGYNARYDFPATMTNEDGISGIEVDYKTLSQYTGLTDKNGNKIYENDIVKLNYIEVREFNGVKYDFKTEFIEEVVFYNGAFQYHLKAEEIDYYRHIVNLPLDKVKVESVEVLGNIFDNPELLGE